MARRTILAKEMGALQRWNQPLNFLILLRFRLTRLQTSDAKKESQGRWHHVSNQLACVDKKPHYGLPFLTSGACQNPTSADRVGLRQRLWVRPDCVARHSSAA